MEINFQTNNFLSSTWSVVLCFFFKKFPHYDKCCEVQCVSGVNIPIKFFTKNKKIQILEKQYTPSSVFA